MMPLKYLLLLTIIFLLCISPTYAQQSCTITRSYLDKIVTQKTDLYAKKRVLDSVHTQLAHCTNDSSLTVLYLYYSYLYRQNIKKNIGSADSAIYYIEKAIRNAATNPFFIEQEVFADAGKTFNLKADVLKNKLEYKTAIILYKKADSLYNFCDTIKNINYINNLGNWAMAYDEIGQPQAAIPLLQKVLYKYKKMNKLDANYNNALVILYTNYLKLNNYPAAEKTLKTIETLRKETLKDTIALAETHAWRAHDLIDLGKLKEADAALDQGFAIFKQKNKTTGGVYAELLRNKAKWCYTIFDYGNALRYADSAVNVTNRRDFKTVSIVEKAKPLNQKARVLSKLERYTEALQVQAEVLKIDTVVNALQDIQHGYHVASLAEIHYEKQDFAKAIVWYKQALKIDAPFGKTNRMAYLPHLFALAQAEYDAKNYANALAHLDTLQIGYTQEIGKHSDYAQADILRARILQATAKYEQAATIYGAGIALLQQQYRLLLTELSEKQQTDLQTNLRQAMNYFCTLPIPILQKHTATLYDLQLQNKAILLNIYQAQQRTAEQMAQKDPKVAVILSELKALRQTYTQASNLSHTQNSTDLQNEIAAKEAELHKQLPNVFDDKTLRNIGWRTVQRKLR